MPKGYGRPLIKPGRELSKVNKKVGEHFGKDDPGYVQSKNLVMNTMDQRLQNRTQRGEAEKRYAAAKKLNATPGFREQWNKATQSAAQEMKPKYDLKTPEGTAAYNKQVDSDRQAWQTKKAKMKGQIPQQTQDFQKGGMVGRDYGK